MNSQRISRFQKTLFIFSILFLLSGCDIIDEILGSGKDESNLAPQQEQALTKVTTIQDDASDIMDNLFTSGMDTLDVIDSLANFFLTDTSIQNVWPDSEGVAVEYNNGISGGIFIDRFLPDTVSGAPPDTFIINNSLNNLSKQVSGYTVLSPINKKSIYFDAAYTQFKKYNDKVITAANSSFSKVGITQFSKYLDHNATIDVLSTLDEYGIIHITGHGWYYRKSQFGKYHETYLLTGEVSVINKTYGDLWADILEKNIIIANYEGENRYWVSPKFVSDRNDFHDDKVFIYNGICNGLRGTWADELVTNAGASVMIGYDWSVNSVYESLWGVKLYEQMCDTSLANPKNIDDCIYDIIHEKSPGYRGWYSVHHRGKLKYIYEIYKGDGDYTFWEYVDTKFERVMLSFGLNVKWDNNCGTSTEELNEWNFAWDGDAFPVNLKLKKSGNTYSGTWEDDITNFIYSGSIAFTLRDNVNTINENGGQENVASSVEFIFKWEPDWLPGEYNQYTITMRDVDYEVSLNGSMSFNISGMETCDHITFNYEESCNINDGSHRYITTYSCYDNAGLTIFLENK